MEFSGVKAHIWQRISAVYLLLYFPYLAMASYSSRTAGQTLAEWMQILFTPAFSVLSFIALSMLITHAWVGVRDIAIDYLPADRVSFWLKLYALFLTLIVIDVFWLVFSFFPL